MTEKDLIDVGENAYHIMSHLIDQSLLLCVYTYQVPWYVWFKNIIVYTYIYIYYEDVNKKLESPI